MDAKVSPSLKQENPCQLTLAGAFEDKCFEGLVAVATAVYAPERSHHLIKEEGNVNGSVTAFHGLLMHAFNFKAEKFRSNLCWLIC